MFSNFEDAFLKKKEIDKPIPKEILKTLSEELPEDFEYTYVGHGACGIKSCSQDLELGLKVEVPDDLLEKFNPSTMQELMDIIYRTQSRIRIIPDEEGCIQLNGLKFNLKDIVKFPLENIKFSDTEWCISPEPFQEPFEIEIQGESVTKNMSFQRQPYADINKSLFKNVDDSVLEITYILDEKNQDINFKFNINIEKSKNVKKIVEGLKLYQSCLNGKMKFAGIDFENFIYEDKAIEKTIELWNRISRVEDELNIEFILEFPIETSDIIWIEKLYCSFVENKSYKEYIKIEKITTNASSNFNEEEIINIKGLMFGFIQNSELNIWGVRLYMYDCIGLFDFKVSNVVLTNKELDEYNLILEPTTEKGIYKSTRHFLMKNNAYSYIKYKDELRNAQVISIE